MLPRYYIIVFCFYLLEIVLLALALGYFSNVEFLNLIIRTFASIVGFYVLKRFIFSTTMYFYPKYIIACVCNPFLSSLIFTLLLRLEFMNSIFLCKFIADLFMSLVIYWFLRI